MEQDLSPEILDFREDQLIRFLKEACERVKRRGKRVTVCLVPYEGERAKALGILDWDKVASLPIDFLSTDPYWIHFGEEMEGFVRKWTEKVLNLSLKYGRKAQIWVQLFRVPSGREEEIRKGIQFISSLEVDGKRVDSLFGWPYLSGEGTELASGKPEKVWEVFTKTLSSAK